MALHIAYEPIERLAPYANNPRTHSAAQIKQIEASLRRFGWCTPIGKADGTLIYGHARLAAAINLRKRNQTIPGHDDPATVPVVDLSHLSETERRAYVIADNQLAVQAGWNEELLSSELIDLKALDFDLSLLGFGQDELDGLLSPPGEADDEVRGELLELVDVTIADPRHGVAANEHWTLSRRHHLLCVSVFDGWPLWKPLLKKGVTFVPYPGPFVPLSVKAAHTAFLLVQPDAYTAGHILDRYAEVHGEESLERQAHAALEA